MSDFLELEELPVGQDWLLEPLKQLGYHGSDEGMCFGFIIMAIQAALSPDPNDIKIFINRLHLINSIPLNEFKSVIETAKTNYIAIVEKAKTAVHQQQETFPDTAQFDMAVEKEIQAIINGGQGDDKEKQLLKEVINIYALFEDIELYQNPQLYPEVFPQNPDKLNAREKLAATSELLLSKKLVSEKGLKKGTLLFENKTEKEFTQTGVYDKETLNVYFQSLKNVFQANKFTQPVAIRLVYKLGEGSHTTTVLYYPLSDKWMFLDINYLSFKPIVNPNTLVRASFPSFFLKPGEKACFTADFTQISSESEKLNQSIKQLQSNPEWNSIHHTMEDLAEVILREDLYGTTHLFNSIIYRDPKLTNFLNSIFDPSKTKTLRTAIENRTTHSFLSSLLNNKDNPGASPFFLAMNKGVYDAAHLLVLLGTDPNVCNKDGDPALFFALVKQHNPLIFSLLNANANPNASTKNGLMTMLDVAVMTQNIDAIHLLLAKGANPNKTAENSQYTALSEATKLDNLAIAEALLKAGADPELPSAPEHLIPMQVAIINGNKQILGLFLSYAPSMTNRPMPININILEHYATEHQCWNEVKALLAKMNGGQLPIKNIELTPIFLATLFGKSGCFSELANHLASTDIKLSSEEWDTLDALAKILSHENLYAIIEQGRDFDWGYEETDFGDNEDFDNPSPNSPSPLVQAGIFSSAKAQNKEKRKDELEHTQDKDVTP